MTVQRPRRTQAERRASTRARILACTAECLLERGYAATTVSAVQERAGLARGTVQHHFPTRAELLIAATTEVVDIRLARFRHEAELLPPGRDRLQSIVDLAWRDLNSPAFFTALDLWVAARTDADLRERLVHEERRVFTEMRRLYVEVLGEPYASDPRAQILVEFTIDLLTGLSMTAMLTGTLGEREAVVRRWKRALAVLVGQLPSDDLLDGSPLPAAAN
ncbi:TetR/AcrR family transcriptional regulator [Nocardia mangyaensis]|uniref:TetR/AcrR family transcriptional regulator n=1 Tax=Nocardia mangyaensis TaxID=2213200 RepID=UPI002676D220|nr:TetR/AcrR family transcriptional regulator [Nocardia mangyaensis]MDO3646321.1 TetR/AcrR family transcriptional regulator [Nocardia mangyaensis]